MKKIIYLAKENRLIVVLGAIIIAVFSAIFFLLSSKSPTAYMEDAQRKIQSGNYSAAVVDIKSALREEPKNARMRLELARASLKLADPVSAERNIKLAREYGLAEDDVIPVLAYAYVLQGKFSQVLGEAPPGEREAHVESRIRTERGYAHLGLRDPSAAMQEFTSAIALAPHADRAIVGQAKILTSQGDFQTAEEKVDGVIGRTSDQDILSDALILKAQLRRLQKDDVGALNAYSGAMGIGFGPGSMIARLGRAEILLNDAQDEKAIKDIDFILKRTPTQPYAVYLKARAHLLRKNDKAAYEILQKQGANLAAFPPSLLLMAQLQNDRGEVEQAQSNLTNYLQLNPSDLDARLLLATVLLRKDLPEQAISILTPTLKDSSNDARITALLAQAAQRVAKSSGAQNALDPPKGDEPHDPERGGSLEDRSK